MSQTKGRSGTVLSIDGQLVGGDVRIVEDCCSQAQASGVPLSLFLRNVSAIDEAGRNLLRRLADHGVRLIAAGVYTSHLVQSLQRTGGTQRTIGPVGSEGNHT